MYILLNILAYILAYYTHSVYFWNLKFPEGK